MRLAQGEGFGLLAAAQLNVRDRFGRGKTGWGHLMGGGGNQVLHENSCICFITGWFDPGYNPLTRLFKQRVGAHVVALSGLLEIVPLPL